MNEIIDVLKLVERHLKNISISLHVMEARERTDRDWCAGSDSRKLLCLYDFDGMDASDNDSSNS